MSDSRVPSPVDLADLSVRELFLRRRGLKLAEKRLAHTRAIGNPQANALLARWDQVREELTTAANELVQLQSEHENNFSLGSVAKHGAAVGAAGLMATSVAFLTAGPPGGALVLGLYLVGSGIYGKTVAVKRQALHSKMGQAKRSIGKLGNELRRVEESLGIDRYELYADQTPHLQIKAVEEDILVRIKNGDLPGIRAPWDELEGDTGQELSDWLDQLESELWDFGKPGTEPTLGKEFGGPNLSAN